MTITASPDTTPATPPNTAGSAADAETETGTLEIGGIDYGREDFSESGRRYDLVLDLVGNRSLRDLRRVLKPSGTIVLSGGGVSGQGRFFGPLSMLIRAPLWARVSRVRLVIPDAQPSTQNLAELAAMVESGSVPHRGQDLPPAIAALPIALWEFSLGVYLVVKGFKPSPITGGMVAEQVGS